MQLFTGQTSFKGAFTNYAKKLELLELLAEPQRLPKLSRLREFSQQAPEGFVFSVVLPSAVLEAGEAGETALAYALKVYDALSPRWLVLRTPTSLRPGPSGERQLSQFFDGLRGRVQPHQLAWEPRGLWDSQATLKVAARLGVQPVLDAREAMPAEVLYVRLMRLGVGARVGSRTIETLAEQVVQSERVYLVVDGASAVPVRREMAELLAEFAGEAEEDDDLDALLDEGADDSELDSNDDDVEDDADDDGDLGGLDGPAEHEVDDD